MSETIFSKIAREIAIEKLGFNDRGITREQTIPERRHYRQRFNLSSFLDDLGAKISDKASGAGEAIQAGDKAADAMLLAAQNKRDDYGYGEKNENDDKWSAAEKRKYELMEQNQKNEERLKPEQATSALEARLYRLGIF